MTINQNLTEIEKAITLHTGRAPSILSKRLFFWSKAVPQILQKWLIFRSKITSYMITGIELSKNHTEKKNFKTIAPDQT